MSTDWLETPKDRTTYKATLAQGEDYCTFEQKPWDEIGSKHQHYDVFIPLMAYVSNETIEECFNSLADMHSITGEKRTFEIVRARGLLAQIRVTGWTVPPWKDLALALVLRLGAPCTDFLIKDSRTLFVALKPSAQVEVEESTSRIGGTDHQRLPVPPGYSTGLGMYVQEIADGADSTPRGNARGKVLKKRKRPTGNALIVLQCMEQKFQLAAPTMAALFDAVGEQIECPRPGRRNEYFRNAVAKLADTESNKWLWRHTGDRVALTATLPEDA